VKGNGTGEHGALPRLQKRPGLVRAFFADPHLRYITA